MKKWYEVVPLVCELAQSYNEYAYECMDPLSPHLLGKEYAMIKTCATSVLKFRHT